MTEARSGAVRLLGREALGAEERERFERMKRDPVRILQIGEGNFLRGFVDWMVHEMRKTGQYDGAIAVTQPRPSGKAKLDQLSAQDGVYTLIVRGMENGAPVERAETVAVFAEAIDPYSQWEALLALAERPELEVVVSNTTEAGLTYQETAFTPGEAPVSYPARLAALLWRRFQALGGDAQRGLLLLPCELLERNGDELKRCVLRHIADWGLPEAFASWVENHNRFLNSLVDRIVTGYPEGDSERWSERLGYEDKLLNAAEPYYIWAIEGEPGLESKLPFRAAGLNVVWTNDLRPYQLRKVRLLNGAHTLMTPVALLAGFEEVRLAIEDGTLGAFVREAVREEIIPAMPSDVEPADAAAYAATVFERFANPYIRHRLLDIAMNSVSKFKARLLPSLESYAQGHGAELPPRIVKSLAHLLRLYRVSRDGERYVGRRFDGAAYTLRDDPGALELFAGVWSRYDAGELDIEAVTGELLASERLWGRSLAELDGLASAVAGHLREMETTA